MLPLISTVIPAFNAERYWSEALASVVAQDYPAMEVIVVDDGSTDRTAELVTGSGARLVSISHAGIGAARNAGVEQASGELLAFLDADDLWVPDKLHRQVAWLAAHPEADMVFGQVQQFHSPELTPAQRALSRCPPAPQKGYVAGAMLVRRTSFDRVGPFDTQYLVGEFVAWYGRARGLGHVEGMLDVTVLRRRLHTTNTGLQQRGSTAWLQVLRDELVRRRAQPQA